MSLETIETMFWSFLGPGEEFKKGDDPISSNGNFSLFLMATYQIISVVILMNVLIVIMNSTVQKVEGRKLLYWKFVRAGIWIRFFDDYQALSPPFNLFNAFVYLYSFIKTKTDSAAKPQEMEEEQVVLEDDGNRKRIGSTNELLARYAANKL